jgi:hypothetical protein
VQDAKTKLDAGTTREASDPVIERDPASPACAHLLDATRPRFELTPHGESAGEWKRPDVAVAPAVEPATPPRRHTRLVAGGAVAALALIALVALVGRRPEGEAPILEAPAAPAPLAAATAPSPAVPAEAVAPSPPAAIPGTVEVQRGDTLWELSGRHLGDPARWPRLHDLNRDRVSNPDLIFPGQELRVPTA